MTKSERSEYHAQWRAKNADHVRRTHAEYYAKNRDRIRAAERERYRCERFFSSRAGTLRQRHPGEIVATEGEIIALWMRQSGNYLRGLYLAQTICALTGRIIGKDEAELDHIVPVTRGGNGCIENLRWVCKGINRAKRDLIDAEFHALVSDYLHYTPQV